MTNFTFDGFEPANTTPVPDVLFDELLPRLSGPQLKVLLYIIRRTAGFKKSSDGISLSQFTDGIKTRDGKVLDNGCGIKKRSTVSKVLQELIAMGCIESAKAKTDMGDDAVTTYSVRFKGVVAKLALPSDEKSTTVVPNQPLPGSAQTATRGSANLATHKKQLTRNSNKQETDLQEGTLPRTSANATSDSAVATSTPAQFAFQIEGWERFYYHDYCVHAGDRGINDNFTFIVKPMSDVPSDAECQICYKPVHGPHGYDELPQIDEPCAPSLDYLTSEQEAAPIVQIVEHETLLRAAGNLIEKNKAISAALSEEAQQDSYSPVPASGYEKEEEQDGVLEDTGAAHHRSITQPVHANAQRGNATATRSQSNKGAGKDEQATQTPLIVEKKPMTLEAQIDAAFKVLDHVRQKLEGNPTASYVQYKTSRGLLKDLIKACAGTPNEVNTQNITLVYITMWNEPAWASGKSWSDVGMLTVAKFCEHYGKYLEIGRAAAAPKPQEPKKDPERGVSGLKRWTPPTSAHVASVQ